MPGAIAYSRKSNSRAQWCCPSWERFIPVGGADEAKPWCLTHMHALLRDLHGTSPRARSFSQAQSATAKSFSAAKSFQPAVCLTRHGCGMSNTREAAPAVPGHTRTPQCMGRRTYERASLGRHLCQRRAVEWHRVPPYCMLCRVTRAARSGQAPA